MRFFVRAIRASTVTLLLDDGQGLAQRRRGAEKEVLSVTLIESPSGHQNFPFPVFLSASAPLREISAAWLQLRRCGGSWRFGFDPAMATTPMRLVPAFGANPGLSSFLGQPGLGVSTPLALARHEPGNIKHPPSPSAFSASLRETTPWLLPGLASSREVSVRESLPRLSPRWGW
jgi:hypothetical protein